jgi:hypothetical protein
MSKNQKIKDAAPGGSNLLMQMKKLHKRLEQSMGRLEENFADIDNVEDEERKLKVKAIANELFDLSEALHDLNLGVDEVLGDDMLNLDEKDVLDKFENLEVIPALIDDLEKNLKNFHKTYYDKTIENDLKVLSFDTIARNWKSLNKNVSRILSNLDNLIQQLC